MSGSVIGHCPAEIVVPQRLASIWALYAAFQVGTSKRRGLWAHIHYRPCVQPPENGRTISTSSSGSRGFDDHSDRRTTEPLIATATNRAAASTPRLASSSLTVDAATSS